MSAPDDTSDKRARLYFICIPRSGSTSILKCLSFFDESEVWFEPFVVCRIVMREYGWTTGKSLPTDWDEALSDEFDRAAAAMQTTNQLPPSSGKRFAFSEVKRAIDDSSKKVVIVKDMSTSFYKRLQYLPSRESGFKFVFIIRDPYRAISSFRKASIGAWRKLGKFHGEDKDFDLQVDDPYYASQRTCYEKLHTVWQHVRKELDPNPLVIDTEDFLASPEPFLQKICAEAGLPYHEGLLRWDASTDPIMKWKNPGGVTQMMDNSLSDFHGTAITSSCFIPRSSSRPRPERSSLTEDVLSAVDRGMKFYEEVYRSRFTP
ncbi:uncharacterized protein [Diadema antillarum]|uniref:uncharacterized protein n=1 Tax=Diadema antillarum TaxID=105358 RepID=UPI003A88A5D4